MPIAMDMLSGGLLSGVFVGGPSCSSGLGVALASVAGSGGVPGVVPGAADFGVYASVGMLLVIAVLFGAGALVATKLFGPSRDGSVKGTAYESGVNPIGNTRKRFNVRFFLLAMSFLLFDVEIVFLYPWAVTFPQLATGEGTMGDVLSPMFLLRMLFFVLTSVLAFAYAWRKGVFSYE